MDDSDTKFWLTLALQPDLGAARLRKLHGLLAAAGPQADIVALAASAGFAPRLLESLAAPRLDAGQRQQFERCLRWADSPERCLLTLASADYPPLLYELCEPPPLLFVWGNPAVLQLPQVALVGSRSPTADGLRHAGRFSRELVAAGYAVTSGMALGIDGASHDAALEAGGMTVAVLGTGLDRLYPRQHRRLAGRIAAQGAVISEFMPDAGADAWHFPQRNRVISGLAHGVLVIEAALRSGSLITARLAAEQGREVFALPGSINNPLARGCHQLIRQGAKLVENVQDMLEELPALLCWERERAAAAGQGPKAAESGCQGSDSELLHHLAYDPVSLDVLALRSGLDIPELQAQLTDLELAGLIALQSGGYVRLGH